MAHDMIFDPQILQPADAATLSEATREAVALISDNGPVSDHARQHVAADVLRIARSGYTRTIDGDLDAKNIAEAAALRFRGFSESS